MRSRTLIRLAVPAALLPGLLLLTAGNGRGAAPAAADGVSFEQHPGRLEIRAGGRPLAAYVYEDERIPRPYFAHVRAPGGIQVTRNHPPVPGRDQTDHDTFHPGLWMAFGELGGADFWRNRARVRHERFVTPPEGRGDSGVFAARSRYEDAGGRLVCREESRFTFRLRPDGYLLDWDSRFFAEGRDVTFGDQEEMGLGVRVATPVSVRAGGTILNSDGLQNEKGVWGRQADWCDYGGIVDGRRVGILLMSHPANFRRPWFHARDYGLLVANPFGRNAFTRGEKSAVTVPRGEGLRLRYGLLIYSVPAEAAPDRAAAYREFTRRD